MIPHAKIVAATDLGPAGEFAIVTADRWCKRLSGSLTVVHVLPESDEEGDAALAAAEQTAREAVLACVRALTGRDAEDFRVDSVVGRPAEETLRAAERAGADLIVIGGREAGATRWVLGSVADGVVAQARMPVLVARPNEGSGRIVAATDFSEPSLPAVRAGHALSRMLGQKVTLVHCLPKGASEADVTAARARLSTICELSPEDDDERVVLGDPADSLVALAEELEASLVIVAASGKSGMQRFMLGSVAERVTRSAPCSVLVVRLRG